MSKRKKKTRKQKIIADLHRQIYSLKSRDDNIDTKKKIVDIIDPLPTPVTTVTIPQVSSYLMRDISKTGMLTLAILILQFVVFFLLKKHIFAIPGISY